MNCKNIKNMISEYIDSELYTDYREKVEEHLNTCPDCKKYFDEIKGLKELISSATFYDLPFDKSVKLARLVKEKGVKTLPPIVRPEPLWKRWQFVSIISVITILILGALFIQIYKPITFLAPMEKAVELAEEQIRGEVTQEEELVFEKVGDGITKELTEKAAPEEMTPEETIESEEIKKQGELITITPEVPPVPQPIIIVSENDYMQKDIESKLIKQKFEEGIFREEHFEVIEQINLNHIVLIKEDYDKWLIKKTFPEIEQFKDFDQILQIIEPEIYKRLTGKEQLPEKFPLLYFFLEKAKFEGKDAYIILGRGPGKDLEEELAKFFICVIEIDTNEILYLDY